CDESRAHRASCGVGDKAFDGIAEAFPIELFGVPANGVAVVAGVWRLGNAAREGVCGRIINEDAGRARNHGLEGAAPGQRNHWAPTGLCLEWHDAEVLFAR